MGISILLNIMSLVIPDLRDKTFIQIQRIPSILKAIISIKHQAQLSDLNQILILINKKTLSLYTRAS